MIALWYSLIDRKVCHRTKLQYLCIKISVTSWIIDNLSALQGSDPPQVVIKYFKSRGKLE